MSKLRQQTALDSSTKLSQYARLYSNRACAYLKRNWKGDVDLALYDSEKAIQLDKNYSKAKLRKIEALKNANMHATAYNYAKQVLEEHKTENVVEETIRNLGVLSVSSPKDDLLLPSASTSSTGSSYQLRSYQNLSLAG